MPFNLLEPYSNFSYAGQASFGHLGLKYQMNTIASLDGFLRVTTYAPLFIAGTQNGVLAIDIMLEGTSSEKLDETANFAWLSYTIGNGNAFSVLSEFSQMLQTPQLTLTNNYGSTATYLPSGSQHLIAGTAYIPFSNGVLTLNQQMAGQWRCYHGNTCQYYFDFFNSAMVGNARILDETGTTLISGATITSESGYDYTQPIADTSVPEPGSLIAVASGLLLLLRHQLS